jgi:tetratricopeptide (TPR) repeat protein
MPIEGCSMSRFRTSAGTTLISLTVLLAAVAFAPASVAQSGSTDGDTRVAADATEEQELSRKERRQQAKQERIDRYLAKKAEKKARKEAERAARAEARAAEDARAAAIASADRDATGSASAEASTTRKGAWARRKNREAASAEAAAGSSEPVAARDVPREIARAQERLRRGPIGEDDDARTLMDRIDAGGASPGDLGRMGNLLARRGYTADAVAFLGEATRRDPTNESLWLNLGTVHLSRNELAPAERAFGKVLSMDPNHAFAHYNLGAVFERAGRYEDAVAAFKNALILDPDLGDPSKNPQAAVNPLMVPVKLELYQMQAGSLALPLQDIDTGDGDD